MPLEHAKPLQHTEHCEMMTLRVDRSDVAARYYPAPAATRACLWVPGAIGGWHSPALGLYPRLAEEFQAAGMASLQVLYRYPGSLQQCVGDVNAGVIFLAGEGVQAAALIGHSFGGAVVIRAAATSAMARTVVALSTQTYGATGIARRLSPHCSILLAHGLNDEILPPTCSQQVYREAGNPKQLLLLPGARHGLDEAADELTQVVRDWITAQLRPAEECIPRGREGPRAA